jgi:lipopolysaccharide transport system permease protein
MVTGMSVTASSSDSAREPVLDLAPETPAGRYRHAAADLRDALKLWRLCWALGWLDVKLRYRGSILGPFWLTASTAVMVAALGIIYAVLFKMDMRQYLPFLSLSLVLWGFISGIVGDATQCFTQSEGMIRSTRMPYTVYAARVVIRNLLVLAHNVVVILGVFALFRLWPGLQMLQILPGLVLWLLDGIAACILLGALGARFRDIAPVIGSIMQIVFFITPIIWKPELMKHGQAWLTLNPFYDLLEIVRQPLLGGSVTPRVAGAAIGFSVLLCGLTALLFTRVRARLAYWV